MSSFSYSERLRLLNLDSLEMHCLRADLMFCFKMLKGFVDVDASEFFERVALDSVTRGHRYKLVHPTRGHLYKCHTICAAVSAIPSVQVLVPYHLFRC